MEIVKSVTINKSATDVFSYVSDFSNHKDIFSMNIDARQDTEGPVCVGTRMTTVAKFLGKPLEDHFVVTEFELNRKITKKSLPESTVPSSDTVVLEPVDAQTTNVRWYLYAEPKGYFKIFGPLLKPMVSRVLAKDLLKLKKLLES